MSYRGKAYYHMQACSLALPDGHQKHENVKQRKKNLKSPKNLFIAFFPMTHKPNFTLEMVSLRNRRLAPEGCGVLEFISCSRNLSNPSNVDISLRMNGVTYDKFIIVSPSVSIEDFVQAFFQVLDEESYDIQIETATWMEEAAKFYEHGARGDKLIRQGVLRHAIRKGLSIIIRDSSSMIVPTRPKPQYSGTLVEKRHSSAFPQKRYSNSLSKREHQVEEIAAAIISQMNLNQAHNSERLDTLLEHQQEIMEVAARHATRMESSVKKITKNQEKHFKGIKKTMETSRDELSTKMDNNERTIRSEVQNSTQKLSGNLDETKSKLSASIEKHNSTVQAATQGLKQVQERANFRCRRCGHVYLLTIYRANEVVCGVRRNGIPCDGSLAQV